MQFSLNRTNEIHPSNTETPLMTRARQGCLLLEKFCVGTMYIFLDIVLYGVLKLTTRNGSTLLNFELHMTNIQKLKTNIKHITN